MYRRGFDIVIELASSPAFTYSAAVDKNENNFVLYYHLRSRST
jgi:hypothetical protein